jgi:hypothetical protein
MKFSGDSYEESLLTARRRFFTLCSMLDVSRYDACVAAHLPITGTALEYYYDSVQAQASDAESVFDHMKARFQTTDVQDRALTKWQATTFASVHTSQHSDGYETLKALYSSGQRIHRALPDAYEADVHLRDFLLRAYSEEPLYSRVPERPASSSSDVLEQLAAAITRYENYILIRKRSSSDERQLRNARTAAIEFVDELGIDDKESDGASEQLYVTRRVIPRTKLETTAATVPKISPATLNPLDKQGVRKTCHGCGSIEHFLFEYPKASREKKINFYDSVVEHGQGEPFEAGQQVAEKPSLFFSAAVTDVDTLLSITAPLPPCVDAVTFLGACVDTGAEVSVAGARQYAAYLRSSALPISQQPATVRTSKKMFRFGTQVFESMHVARIRFPVTPITGPSPAFLEFKV